MASVVLRNIMFGLFSLVCCENIAMAGDGSTSRFAGKPKSVTVLEQTCDEFLLRDGDKNNARTLCLDRVLAIEYYVTDVIRGDLIIKGLPVARVYMFYHGRGLPTSITFPDSIVTVSQQRYGLRLDAVDYGKKFESGWMVCEQFSSDDSSALCDRWVAAE
ncbi:hypothetical protein [Parahaliea mediterranea]|uniref:Uncharacterized protein n=1 Tax=Parahaliea mediterranea TaxID=651086 RepID=A0A939DJP1_9GAMM|nr:hypothetical protein [Parahaliea mediterranea]MBN7799198.1 hypothetical protein [Parahaliea mediterranea]